MPGWHMDHRGQRLVGLATVLAVLPGAAWAHTVGVEGDAALARGLNMSVLFLLSMPVAIVGVIVGTVYLAQKRAQRHRHQHRAGTRTASASRTHSRRVWQVLARLFLE